MLDLENVNLMMDRRFFNPIEDELIGLNKQLVEMLQKEVSEQLIVDIIIKIFALLKAETPILETVYHAPNNADTRQYHLALVQDPLPLATEMAQIFLKIACDIHNQPFNPTNMSENEGEDEEKNRFELVKQIPFLVLSWDYFKVKRSLDAKKKEIAHPENPPLKKSIPVSFELDEECWQARPSHPLADTPSIYPPPGTHRSSTSFQAAANIAQINKTQPEKIKPIPPPSTKAAPDTNLIYEKLKTHITDIYNDIISTFPFESYWFMEPEVHFIEIFFQYIIKNMIPPEQTVKEIFILLNDQDAFIAFKKRMASTFIPSPLHPIIKILCSEIYHRLTQAGSPKKHPISEDDFSEVITRMITSEKIPIDEIEAKIKFFLLAPHAFEEARLKYYPGSNISPKKHNRQITSSEKKKIISDTYNKIMVYRYSPAWKIFSQKKEKAIDMLLVILSESDISSPKHLIEALTANFDLGWETFEEAYGMALSMQRSSPPPPIILSKPKITITKSVTLKEKISKIYDDVYSAHLSKHPDWHNFQDKDLMIEMLLMIFSIDNIYLSNQLSSVYARNIINKLLLESWDNFEKTFNEAAQYIKSDKTRSNTFQ